MFHSFNSATRPQAINLALVKRVCKGSSPYGDAPTIYVAFTDGTDTHIYYGNQEARDLDYSLFCGKNT